MGIFDDVVQSVSGVASDVWGGVSDLWSGSPAPKAAEAPAPAAPAQRTDWVTGQKGGPMPGLFNKGTLDYNQKQDAKMDKYYAAYHKWEQQYREVVGNDEMRKEMLKKQPRQEDFLK